MPVALLVVGDVAHQAELAEQRSPWDEKTSVELH